MEKKLYYKLEDNTDADAIIMELSQLANWIKANTENLSEWDIEKKSYTITPVYMTEEEFSNLPEADIF